MKVMLVKCRWLELGLVGRRRPEGVEAFPTGHLDGELRLAHFLGNDLASGQFRARTVVREEPGAGSPDLVIE